MPEAAAAWGHFTRRHAVALLFMREHVSALRALERGPWACLQAIAPHWQGGRADAFPGQERLALLSGYDSRSIRDFTRQLEARGVVDVVRVKLADGTARLHYEPGPVLLAAVEQFEARFSDERAKPVVLPEPPAMVSGGGPAAVSGELSDRRDHENSSFCAPAKPAGEHEPDPQGSELDRDVAREALGMLRERRFGHRGRLFDARLVAMVAASVSAIEGDRETKLRAQLDAIAHAFSVSRGAPTPAYIWGNIDLFLHHEAHGRNARSDRALARARQARAAEAERTRARERSRQDREACGPPPEVLQFIAELQRGKSELGGGGRRCAP